MQLSDREFIDKRRRLIRWWPPALLLMVVMLAGTWIFLYIKHPVLASPSFVIDALDAGTLSAAIMQLSAVLLPLMVCFLFLALAIMLLYLHLAIRNERRYQAIIGRQR